MNQPSVVLQKILDLYKVQSCGGLDAVYTGPVTAELKREAAAALNPRTPEERWADDSIQFPRLLAEIYACGLTNSQWKALCDEMSLTSKQLRELFDRADQAWDFIKERL